MKHFVWIYRISAKDPAKSFTIDTKDLPWTVKNKDQFLLVTKKGAKIRAHGSRGGKTLYTGVVDVEHEFPELSPKKKNGMWVELEIYKQLRQGH